jgi:hypothetical protein
MKLMKTTTCFVVLGLVLSVQACGGTEVKESGIFVDDKGHPDDVLVDLGSLVWLKAIYGVEPNADLLSSTYETDLVTIAKSIIDDHEQEYEAYPVPAIGYNSLFIGHSFFRPFADNMKPLSKQAGIEAHDQQVVFSGGANGAPQALWEDEEKRDKIQNILDAGDIELFAMTYEPTYPTDEGYRNWFDYALSKNPNTKFVLALPWPDFSGNYDDGAEYESDWEDGHDNAWHALVDGLRAAYPDNEVICIPYGRSALELRTRLEAGELPDVDVLISGN